MSRDYTKKNQPYWNPAHRTGLPDRFVKGYARAGGRMCQACLIGVHSCDVKGCLCCCNDPDFPWPLSPGVTVLLEMAIKRGAIPGKRL